jgi:hypothetical protein
LLALLSGGLADWRSSAVAVGGSCGAPHLTLTGQRAFL